LQLSPLPQVQRDMQNGVQTIAHILIEQEK
jgi:hypothetical protein